MAEKNPVFLIYHEKKEEAASIELEIRQRKCAVERASKPSEVLEFLITKPATCVVLNLRRIDTNIILFGSKVGAISKNVLTLAMYDECAPNLDEQMHGLSNFVSIQKPVKDGALGFMCEKIIQGKALKQRVHSRYPSDQTGTLNKFGESEKFQARVLNLSKGGAYIEFSGTTLKPNDVIKVTILLDKISKTRTMTAKIMWVSPGEKFSGAGVEFINDDEAYLSLVEKS